MSSILEALKKLEEDKAARRGGIGNIAGRVTSTPRRSRMLPTWVWPSAMAAVALCAVLVTFTFMGGFTKPSSSPPCRHNRRPGQLLRHSLPPHRMQLPRNRHSPGPKQERSNRAAALLQRHRHKNRLSGYRPGVIQRLRLSSRTHTCRALRHRPQ